MHQGRLLAADESACAQPQSHIEGEAAAEDVFSQKPVFLRLLDGDLQPLYRNGVFGSHVDITLAGADGIACDGHGLDDRVGVALQDAAVHKGAGVALVGVAAGELLPVGADGVVGELPFLACGESGAAAAAQTGGLDQVDHLLGLHLGEDLAQRLISADADVFVDVFRVDDAAVAQGDTLLMLVEFRVRQRGRYALFVGLLVQEPLHDPTLDDMLGDDLLDVVFLDVGIKCTLRIDQDDGTHGTKAKAARPDDPDLLVHARLSQFLVEEVDQLRAVAGAASGPGADHDV